MTENMDIGASVETSAASPGSPAVAGVSARRLFGHPVGLWYLAFAEAWERFSYYGMQTLLVLYMVSQLLQPGHIESVAGFGAFRVLIEGAYGPLSTQALASVIFGLYTGLVYLTPVLGGLLADRWLGRTRTILLGGVLMTLGHFLMAFDVSFLWALACLAIGTGCFKGNIAVQVGSLYAPEDNARADAFQIFYLGISAGVIASPLVCGTLGEVYGWHYGFAAAGVGMAAGMGVYLMGARFFPPDQPIVRRQESRPRLSKADWRVLALLLAMLPVLALALLGNQQIFNAYMVWAQSSFDFSLLGRTMPTSWLITFDAAASVVMLALSVLFWRVWSRRFLEPDEITKLVIGAVLTVLAFLVLAAGAAQSVGGARISLWWAVAFHVINSIGFAHLVPVALALYVRMAPKAIGATIVGVFYLHLFLANNLVGWAGTRLETMAADRFWLAHALVAGASALILFGLQWPIKRVMAKTAAEPWRPDV